MVIRRIGIIGPIYPDSFADNVVDTLRTQGYEAVSLGSPRWRLKRPSVRFAAEFAARIPVVEKRTEAAFVDKVVAAEVDLVLALESVLGAASIEALRRRGVITSLWFPDAISNLGHNVFAAPYDFLFWKDPLLARRVRDVLAAESHYAPEACNPKWHRPAGVSVEPFIAVVGNIYPFRYRLIERLLSADIPIRIYGPPPARDTPARVSACHVGRYVAREEKAAVFEQACGVLNNIHPSELESVNCRLFEASASGGVVLCEMRGVLPSLFVPEVEVLPFTHGDELVDRCREVLTDPGRWTGLRAAASRRAHRDHTYAARLAAILATIDARAT